MTRKKKEEIIKKPTAKKTAKIVYSLMNNANVDVKEPEEQTWDEVEDLYQALGSAIIETGEQVNKAIIFIKNAKENYPSVNIPASLVIAANGLGKDLEMFTTDLLKIKDGHKDKTGVIKTDDDLALSLAIFNDYVILNERFKSIVFQPLLTITETMADIAGVINKEKKNQSEEQNNAEQ